MKEVIKPYKEKCLWLDIREDIAKATVDTDSRRMEARGRKLERKKWNSKGKKKKKKKWTWR